MTKRAPTAAELSDLRFAWRAVKHVKSNAVVIAREGATVGIGGGQQNRKTPVELALRLAGEKAKGAVLASDAFFPFARDDAVEMACRAGVTAIIQPGGAVRDEEAVEVCDEYETANGFHRSAPISPLALPARRLGDPSPPHLTLPEAGASLRLAKTFTIRPYGRLVAFSRRREGETGACHP